MYSHILDAQRVSEHLHALRQEAAQARQVRGQPSILQVLYARLKRPVPAERSVAKPGVPTA